MVKKWFGSLICLAFVFGFTASLLILLKPAEATRNVKWIRPLTIHYVCAGESANIVYSEEGEKIWTATVNHPPKTYQPTRAWGGGISLEHTPHGMENRRLNRSETEYRTLWKEDDWRCR
ncbi:MAG: hypothetical protein OXH39_24075 [Candidatus Poribacteria bacterium]|nr:hypothetical protein [Candidatus Poribacteria bacterium]